MAPARHPPHHHLGARALTRRAVVAADLVVEVGGRRLHLSGRHSDLVLRLDAGALPRADRATVAGGASALARTGVRLTVVDHSGRTVAVAGHGVRSRVGRLVTGSPHVRIPPAALLRRALPGM